MAIQTHGYLLITGLSTDTKPSSSILEGTYFIETDTHSRYEYLNSAWVLVGAGSSTYNNLVDVTYSELSNKITNSELISGQLYKITDFSTVYEQYSTNIVSISPTGISDGLENSIEEIIVRAVDVDTISKDAISTINLFDIIYYDHTQETLTGGYNTKGSITRRINTEYNIDCNYDFRGVKYRLYQSGATDVNPVTTYVYGNVYKESGITKMYVGSNAQTIYEDYKICDDSETPYLLHNTLIVNGVTLPSDPATYKDVYSLYDINNDTSPLSNFKNIKIDGNAIVLQNIANVEVSNIYVSGSLLSIVLEDNDVNIINTSNSLIIKPKQSNIGSHNTQTTTTILNQISNSELFKDTTNNIICLGELSYSNINKATNSTFIGVLSNISSNNITDSKIITNCDTFKSISCNILDIYGDVYNISGSNIDTTNIDKASVISNTLFTHIYDTNFVNSIISDCLFENKLENTTVISGTHNDTRFGCKIDNITLDKINFNNCLVDVPYLNNLAQPSTQITIINQNINKYFEQVDTTLLLGYEKTLQSGSVEIVWIG